MKNTYRISFTYRFEAAHRFTKSCADSCATPHGHTWYAKAVFEAEESELGQDEMVLEFSKLKRDWKKFIQDTVDHSFMHNAEDPIVASMREHIPKFRGLPFPGDPTTEMIATLFFAKLERMSRELGVEGVRPVAVEIRETPTNSIRYSAARASARVEKISREGVSGWWASADPADRSLTMVNDATRSAVSASVLRRLTLR